MFGKGVPSGLELVRVFDLPIHSWNITFMGIHTSRLVPDTSTKREILEGFRKKKKGPEASAKPAARRRIAKTPARTAASRANSAQSTGPRSPGGKWRTSRNLPHQRSPRLLGSVESRLLGQEPGAAEQLYREITAPFEPVPALVAIISQAKPPECSLLSPDLRGSRRNEEISQSHFRLPVVGCRLLVVDSRGS